ncbi:glycosyl hydrolase 115 family protein [Parvularcula sp. LCG005]|uniref:glycosyl hydrolase 115 family protein n=1 Tax=Parvularcula sp. LCG005 TaxID=3078805 RepID=UPI002943B10E|nr:glycosyl hydrolase 115 family protein [Parvularcula sp. LCG005]WOI54164.1 glycosyl hydrolase 115 family protein [Parvularcula sp. LCG005]
MKLIFAALAVAFSALSGALAADCDVPASVCFSDQTGAMDLVAAGTPATVLTDADADKAVLRVANDFALDLERVSGKAAKVVTDQSAATGPLVIIGVAGQSALIDGLAAAGKIDLDAVNGGWEAYSITVVENPYPDVPAALVIAGADRRGAIFGTYEMSEEMGVSPWHYFADVPTEQRTDVFVTAGMRQDQPVVKYRGFFINDEDPALGGWAREQFGGVNADMYEHVFELLLRLQGNYIWPAMWGKALYDDDPRSGQLAQDMGIVVGTSHHEPLMRAHVEWGRHGDGEWNFDTNAEGLEAFWRDGMERSKDFDKVVTVGMRGDGDEAMSEDTAIGLLEKVVASQREIIADVTGAPAAETPQVWALYKEVQDYYDQGMSVPDDVTLLFADDNWGQNRRLPTQDLDREGGFGVYYHFDYVGAPRSYKWTNTNQIEKTWQQMDLAYRRGVEDIWIVNVGDIKPMEYPLDFFMAQAWDPEEMTLQELAAFPQDWAAETFGDQHGAAIADLVTRYSRYAARRKPEFINAESWPIGEIGKKSLTVGEFGTYTEQWHDLVVDMEKVKAKLRDDQMSAYYQLVEYPIASMANIYDLYHAVAWNRALAKADDARANYFADLAEAAFKKDAALAYAYHALEDGKWIHMMAQPNIGYTDWRGPEQDVMPEVTRVDGKTPKSVTFKGAVAPSKIVINADDYDRMEGNDDLRWSKIAHLGSAGEGAMIVVPQGMPSTTQEDGIRLEYDVDIKEAGDLTIGVRMSPTLDTRGTDGNKIGISLDDGPLQVLNLDLIPHCCGPQTQQQVDWDKAVTDNGFTLTAAFDGVSAGKHTVKLWRLDDNVIVEKLSIATN